MNSAFKGKGSALPSEDPDFEDLNPPITYRHLLGPYNSVKHPLRVVALCDGDAFYAGCERVRLDLDWEVPLVVNQWGMVIAVNYPARSYGISRIDKIPDCLKRCPHLKVVHVATYAEGEDEAKYWKNPNIKTHKVSLDLYRRESDKIITMFKEGLPTGEVEKASIDEAFIDFTNPVREKILKRFPYLAKVPPDAPNGMDTPLPPPPVDAINWEGFGNLIPVHPPPKVEPKAEPKEQQMEPVIKPEGLEQEDTTSIQEMPDMFDVPETDSSTDATAVKIEDHLTTNESTETFVSVPKDLPQNTDTSEDAKIEVKQESCDTNKVESLEEPPPTWHDVALSIAAELMQKIRMDIYTKLGYTTSAGIARNKFLSKLAAGYKKPFNQSILRNAAIPKFLRPMPFQKIRYLGGKLGKELAKEYDAKTVSEMHKISLEEMQNKFGESSIWVYEILRGIDRFEVKEKPLVRKSMLASKTLPEPVTRVADGPHWIRMLAAELSIRLKEARETTPGLWPKTISLHVSQGWHFRRSKQAPFPYTKDITIDVIAQGGVRLWNELVGKDGTYYGTAKLNVSGMSLSLCHIDWMEEGQKNIKSFFSKQTTSTGVKRESERQASVGAVESDLEIVGVESKIESGPISTKRRWRSASVVSTAPSENSEVIDVDALEIDIDETEPAAKRILLVSADRNSPHSSSRREHAIIDNERRQGGGKPDYNHQNKIEQDGTDASKGKGKEVLDFDPQSSFRCSRCGQIITIDPKYLKHGSHSRKRNAPPQEQQGNVASSSAIEEDDQVGEISDEERQRALATLRIEHDDFHFAQDLAKGGEPIKVLGHSTGVKDSRRSTSEPLSAPGKGGRDSMTGKNLSKKRQKPVEPEGIARYFIRK